MHGRHAAAVWNNEFNIIHFLQMANLITIIYSERNENDAYSMLLADSAWSVISCAVKNDADLIVIVQSIERGGGEDEGSKDQRLIFHNRSTSISIGQNLSSMHKIKVKLDRDRINFIDKWFHLCHPDRHVMSSRKCIQLVYLFGPRDTDQRSHIKYLFGRAQCQCQHLCQNVIYCLRGISSQILHRQFEYFCFRENILMVTWREGRRLLLEIYIKWKILEFRRKKTNWFAINTSNLHY